MPLPTEGYTIPDKEAYLEELYEVDKSPKNKKAKLSKMD